MKKNRSSFDVKKPEESPGFLLWQVTNLWQRRIRESLRVVGLTHTQFVLLASILWFSEHERSIINQTRLSAHSKIDVMTVSTVLRTLQSRGLLKKKPHNTDSRAYMIELSSAGKKIAQQSLKFVAKCDKKFFEPLGRKKGEFNKMLFSLLT